MLRVSIMTLLALGLAAQEPAKPAPAPAAPAPAAPAQPAAPAPKPEDKVLARVAGEPITEADFRAAFRLLPQQEQMQILMIQGGKEEFVRRMAEGKLLTAKARMMGLDQTAEFKDAQRRMTDDLLAREFLTKEGETLQKQLKVSDEEVKAFYDHHLDKFSHPSLVTVSHILVAVKRDPKAKEGLTDAEAKKKIAKIQGDLKKKGASFADLAKKYSDDPGSKDNGGRYDDVDPANWDPAFAKAAEAQPIGKVGAPVKSQFGYHLIKVEGRKPAGTTPFEEAKAEATQMAQRERQTQVWEQLMARLKKEIPFELVAPEVPKPKPAPAPAAAPVPKTPAPAPAQGGAH